LEKGITMQRPNEGEYAPYYNTYISKVPEGNIIDLLTQQIDSVKDTFKNISEEKSLYRYAPDKWSIRQVLGHINDGEHIFPYRALRFSRNDKNNLSGFNQDEFAKESNFDNITLANLLEEFIKVREANIVMFKNFSDEMWTRHGIANNKEITVRAIAYIMYGHVTHHLNVIKEKYL
jgi:uncharacterized damage-inducible protein DinB